MGQKALSNALLRGLVVSALSLGLIVSFCLRLVVSLFGISLLGSRLLLLGSGRGSADLGFTDEDGSWLNGEGAGFHITDHFRAGFDIDPLGAGDVSMDLAVNDNGLGFDLGLDGGVLSHGEGSIGSNFSFDATVDKEVVSEEDRSIDVDVVTKNITLSPGSGSLLLGWSLLGRGCRCRGCSRCGRVPGVCHRSGCGNRGSWTWSRWIFGRFADDFFEHGIGYLVKD